MVQIFEYIAQHYIWFLSGAILIILAIIGYYADKTNFGQGKNLESKKENDQDPIKNLEGVRLPDIYNNGNINKKDVSKQESSNQLNNVVASVNNSINASNNISTPNVQSEQLQNLNAVQNATSPSYQNMNSGIQNIGPQENIVVNNLSENSTNELLSKEAIDKFNDEFESILPKKEIISTDLLSDIEDLKLGKTQKIDLSSVPDLDDIDLPRIKKFTPEEQDIWKF